MRLKSRPKYTSSNSGIQPLTQWHLWLHKIADDHPSTLPVGTFEVGHVEHMTGTRGAFRTYNTTKPKLSEWIPQVRARE